MTDLEIQAEVFRIVRANIDRSKKQIIKAIKQQLPEATDTQIADALYQLSK